MRRRVLEADYHRNGSAGEGFYVGIIRDTDGLSKLVVCFPEYADADAEALADWQPRVAVVGLAAANLGNIYMHAAPFGGHDGGNAWDGVGYGAAVAEIVHTARERKEAALAAARAARDED